jgi:Ca2+/Na+ antiporter
VTSENPIPESNPTPHGEQEKDSWDRWKPLLEIVGIALLAVYTAYTIKMYRANKQSADAARDAAVAAKQSADTQEDSFQLERRRAEDQEEAICRLGTDGMAALDHVGHVRVVNSGKSEARNLDAHVDTFLADAITLKKLRDLGSVDISTSELGNNQSLDRGINLPLTAHDWQTW